MIYHVCFPSQTSPNPIPNRRIYRDRQTVLHPDILMDYNRHHGKTIPIISRVCKFKSRTRRFILAIVDK
jgi:hypothetical protein